RATAVVALEGLELADVRDHLSRAALLLRADSRPHRRSIGCACACATRPLALRRHLDARRAGGRYRRLRGRLAADRDAPSATELEHIPHAQRSDEHLGLDVALALGLAAWSRRRRDGYCIAARNTIAERKGLDEAHGWNGRRLELLCTHRRRGNRRTRL